MNSYQIKELTKKYTDYDMIKRHTDLPEFPEIRSRILFLFLHSDKNNTHVSELFTLVTTLIQMGLDTHDLVSSSNDVKEKIEVRSRQMKVLAGDYFSSKFYHLLSKAGKIDLIHKLSLSVCEVNQLKMNVYMMMKNVKLTADEYIHYMADIKSSLFLTFSEFIAVKHRHAWKEMIKEFSRCEVIFREWLVIESSEHFRKSWAYWFLIQQVNKDERKQLLSNELDDTKRKVLMNKYAIKSTLYELYAQQVIRLSVAIKSFELDPLADELFHIAEPLFRLIQQPKVLEEI